MVANAITNERKPGKAALIKTDGTNFLNGVTFELYKYKEPNKEWEKKGNSFVSGFVYADILTAGDKNSDGVLSIGGLDWGAYYIEETGTLNGYVLDRKKYGFTIGKGQKPSNTAGVTDYKEGTAAQKDTEITADLGTIVNQATLLSIEKLDADSKNLIDGAEFTIEAADPTEGFPTAKITTNSTGAAKVTAQLRTGKTYTIQETKVPDGYQKSSKAAKKFAFTLDADGTVTKNETFPNKLWTADYISIKDNKITVFNAPIKLTVEKKMIKISLCRMPAWRFMRRYQEPLTKRRWQPGLPD